MLNKSRLLFACVITCTLFLQYLPAQEDGNAQEPNQETETLPEPEKAPAAVDAALQRNFTIVQSVHRNGLNPHTASYSSEAQILSGLFEGLFSYDPVTLDPRPAVAVDYHLSRNKLRWTFTLRDDAKFSNGEPITADTVKESWLGLLANPDASYASLFDMVKGAKEFRSGKTSRDDVGIIVRDEKTIVLQLVSPASHLPRILCHHAFSVVNKDPSVTSGAFVISENTDKKLVMTKNKNYWDADNVYIPQITVIQSDDVKENAFMFNTGAADWVADAIDINSMLAHNSIRIHAEYGTQYLFFKNSGSKDSESPWDNPDFRNALLTAVPWADLRKGSFVPATTFVYPIGNYPAVNGFNYTDSLEAADLMKEAREKASIPADKELPLVFAVIDTKYMIEEAELLKKAWEPLGVAVSIEKIPAQDYLESIADRKADLFSYTWIGDFADPLAMLELFRGNSTLNPSRWSNTEFDSLLDKAAASSSDEEHLKLLSDAEQLLLDSGEVLPVSHPVSLHAIDLGSTGGWSVNALDLHPLKYLYFKHKTVKIPNLVLR